MTLKIEGDNDSENCDDGEWVRRGQREGGEREGKGGREGGRERNEGGGRREERCKEVEKIVVITTKVAVMVIMMM